MSEPNPRTPDGDDWPEYKIHVLSSLKRVEDKLGDLTEKVVSLRIQAGTWGAVAGLVTGLITALVVAAVLHSLGF